MSGPVEAEVPTFAQEAASCAEAAGFGAYCSVKGNAGEAVCAEEAEVANFGGEAYTAVSRECVTDTGNCHPTSVIHQLYTIKKNTPVIHQLYTVCV